MGKVILAGDIGGTKTHLALFEEGEKRDWLCDAKYQSAEHGDLRSIIVHFLQENPGHEVVRGCFGIAGPIQDRKCKATNLPWMIDADILEKKANIPHVDLINDLEANAYGINVLEEGEFFLLNEGKKMSGNAALISAGTGLGEAGLFFNGNRHLPFACEGGHCSFAPENEVEIRLFRYLKKKHDHVSFERVLSGPGLLNLYEFLVDEGIEKEDEVVKEAFKKSDPPKVITQMGKTSAACAHALDLFVSIYGSEAANLALKMLAVGGIYIGGGIAPKMLNELAEGDFMVRFIQKGRFTSLLLGIPVKVILNPHTALLGAAYYARERNG